MIKIDLVTGFLGSGKTTFIHRYAAYLMNRGLRVAILENDYGAVNVDMLLLHDLEEAGCELEMIAVRKYFLSLAKACVRRKSRQESYRPRLWTKSGTTGRYTKA